MINLGRTDLVRAKPLREKKPKTVKSKQQELGCSDDLTDSNNTSELSSKRTVDVQNSVSVQFNSSTSPETPQTLKKDDTQGSLQDQAESEKRQSTGDCKAQSDRVEQGNQIGDKEKSKTIMSSIKSFFKFQISQCFVFDVYLIYFLWYFIFIHSYLLACTLDYVNIQVLLTTYYVSFITVIPAYVHVLF